VLEDLDARAFLFIWPCLQVRVVTALADVPRRQRSLIGQDDRGGVFDLYLGKSARIDHGGQPVVME